MVDTPDRATTLGAQDSGRFVFSEEQRDLRAVVRKYAVDHADEQTVRRLMVSAPGFDPNAWRRLGSELGVLGLSVPEEQGGAGGTLVDQAVAVEELGAALYPGPVFGTVLLAIPTLLAASDGPVRGELLHSLVEGNRTAAVAVTDRAGAFDPSSVNLSASRRGHDWRLSGTVERVVDATVADDLLVAAGVRDGVALFAVDAVVNEVQRIPLTTLDLTRRQATLRFADVPARLVAGPDDAERVIARALLVGSVLLGAEQVGAAQHLLDLTVEHAKRRLQFGRPIGSFQAVKHRLADMLVGLEHARSAVYHAVWALRDRSDDPTLAASIAQATVSEAFTWIAAQTIQLHGGIGFTWEHQSHLYYKRAVTDAALLGSAEQHRARIARMVLDSASPENAPAVATGVPAAAQQR